MNKLMISFVAVLSFATIGCKKKGGDALSKLEEFQKSMCECKDKACADKVHADMTKWGSEAKSAKPDDKPDPELAKKSGDLMMKYTECMTKASLAMADGGGDKPAGGDTPPPAAVDVDANSVTFESTGKLEKGDNPADEYAVFKVTNNSKRKLFYIHGVHYYYDKDGKQLGRRYFERTVGTIEPGESKEIGWGETKAQWPAGTETVQAVFVKGNFQDKVEFKGDEKALAPDQRPMSK